MKVSVLATGSKGNCTYIETKQCKVLVDLGTTSLYAERNLKELGVNPKEIDAIFLTHTHVDHVAGLRVFLKKNPTKVYLTEKMYRELRSTLQLIDYEFLDDLFCFADLTVEVMKTSHDVDDSNAYLFTNEESSLVYITDTGYINTKYHEKLKNKTMYIIESNHDVNLLMNGSYPFHLKQRILGDRGHLSNKQCSYYLSKLIGENTKEIVLIHLSQDNNRKEIAYEETFNSIKEQQETLPTIVVSEQHTRTELLEV